MKHPNTIAACVAYGISMGVQYLVARYAHLQLSDWWKQVVNGAAASAVLYVGKAGVKAALLRIWNGPKKVWTGTTAPAK